MRIYAVGDIHGRLDLLDRLLDLIQNDNETRGAARTQLVFLGDYIDRGSDSKGVVSRLISEPPPGFSRVCLKGNHEAMLLAFLDEPGAGVNWLHNGGNEALLSYGVEAGCYPGRIFSRAGPGWLRRMRPFALCFRTITCFSTGVWSAASAQAATFLLMPA